MIDDTILAIMRARERVSWDRGRAEASRRGGLADRLEEALAALRGVRPAVDRALEEARAALGNRARAIERAER